MASRKLPTAWMRLLAVEAAMGWPVRWLTATATSFR
jgi:predicted dithiol-disulfide oxidoreductase (DUF899 family)